MTPTPDMPAMKRNAMPSAVPRAPDMVRRHPYSAASVMIITLAAEYGWRRTMSGALGTALGIAFLFIAGMSGVGVIVASSPMLFAAIKLLGACFLIWLSLKLPCLKTEDSL